MVVLQVQQVQRVSIKGCLIVVGGKVGRLLVRYLSIGWGFVDYHMILISAGLGWPLDLGVRTTCQFGVPAFVRGRLHIIIIFKMGDFAADLLAKLGRLGFTGVDALTPDTLHDCLSGMNETRFATLFRYLLDTVDHLNLVTEADQVYVDSVCDSTGLAPASRLLDELRAREVTRALQLERDREREVSEMEAEIGLIERQIEAKGRQLEVIEDALVVQQGRQRPQIDEKRVSEAQVMSERAVMHIEQSQQVIRGMAEEVIQEYINVARPPNDQQD